MQQTEERPVQGGQIGGAEPVMAHQQRSRVERFDAHRGQRRVADLEQLPHGLVVVVEQQPRACAGAVVEGAEDSRPGVVGGVGDGAPLAPLLSGLGVEVERGH